MYHIKKKKRLESILDLGIKIKMPLIFILSGIILIGFLLKVQSLNIDIVSEYRTYFDKIP